MYDKKGIAGSYLSEGEERFKSKMIASIADEKNNVAYFFCASPVPKAGLLDIPPHFITTAYAEELINLANDQNFTSTVVKFVDSIIEVNPQDLKNVSIFTENCRYEICENSMFFAPFA